MTVELEMQKEGVLTLEEIEEEVRDGLRALADVHEEEAGGTRHLLARVKRAATTSDLLALFTGVG